MDNYQKLTALGIECKNTSTQQKVNCPFCKDIRSNKRDKSLSVNVELGVYKCHYPNCEAFMGKSVSSFERKPEYILPVSKLQKVSDKVLSWFESRGISNNTLLQFKVTEEDAYFPQVQENRKAICFNYFRGPDLINIKYRDAAKNFKMVKDAELIMYNLNAIEGYNWCVIVEGEMDALSMHEAQIYPVVSVPNGATKGNQNLKYLDNCIDHFKDKDKIIIFTDNDSSGISLREELARRLGKERVWYINPIEGCKDANDILINYGVEAIQKVIAESYQVPIEGIEKVHDVKDKILDIYTNGFPHGLKVGFSDFDDHMSFRGGEFTIITGTPNAGKSTFLSNVLVRLASKHGWKIAMFSPEKQPTEILFSELAEIYIGKSFSSYNQVLKMSREELQKAEDFVDENFFFMKIDEIDVTIDGILAKASELVQRNGINCLVIDPWNYVEHKYERGTNETQYISEALTKIKRFKDRFGVHVFVVAHPTKIRKENGSYVVPTLYDIAGSAHFFNKCDNGFVVYRDYATGQTKVYIQKIRWSFIGKVGDSNFMYDVSNKRFTSIMDDKYSFNPISDYEQLQDDITYDENIPF
jgi:twinkle protein